MIKSQREQHEVAGTYLSVIPKYGTSWSNPVMKRLVVKRIYITQLMINFLHQNFQTSEVKKKFKKKIQAW